MDMDTKAIKTNTTAAIVVFIFAIASSVTFPTITYVFAQPSSGAPPSSSSTPGSTTGGATTTGSTNFQQFMECLGGNTNTAPTDEQVRNCFATIYGATGTGDDDDDDDNGTPGTTGTGDDDDDD